MAFNEEAWVSQYVQKGGDDATGRAIARKMAAARNALASGRAPGRTSAGGPIAGIADNLASALKPLSAQPSPTRPPSPRASQATHPASAPAPRPGCSNEVQAPALPCTPSSTGDADLFGNTPSAEARSRGAAKTSTSKIRPGRKPVAFDARVPSQRELELFQLSMEIDDANAKESGDLGYLATAMIYASLPHSNVAGGVFKRRNGATTISIVTDPDIGLPYGKIPRLLTAFLCTEAKRRAQTHGRVIELGRSGGEFLAKLGIPHNTAGANGPARRVAEQAKRLFMAQITLTGEPGSQFHFKKLDLTQDGMLLWNPQDASKKSPWQSQLTLSEKFFDECINHSVPIDLRVLHELRSPLAIDIYIWLTYRYNSISRPTPITWQQLQWQFGANYPNTNRGAVDFRANFKKQLRQVIAIYPQAKLKVTQDWLMLLPSRPHILPKVPPTIDEV